jgi:Bifunctional DNA primase/polymerase, N-terminal
MSNPTIPSDINSWSKAQTAEYYIDKLGWTLTSLIEGSKEPKNPKEQQYGVGRSDLLLDLSNGCNLGLFPSGTHVVLDLDSKSDHGKSVQKFLAQTGPRVQSLPRERTAGGVHIHLRIKDIETVKRQHPKANKLVSKKVSSKVGGELFFGGTGYVVTSPSLHEAGTRYEWETFGEIPEWSWREFTATFNLKSLKIAQTTQPAHANSLAI